MFTLFAVLLTILLLVVLLFFEFVTADIDGTLFVEELGVLVVADPTAIDVETSCAFVNVDWSAAVTSVNLIVPVFPITPDFVFNVI